MRFAAALVLMDALAGRPAVAVAGSDRAPSIAVAPEDRVAWLPWSAAAFEKARREVKPVFLVVGSFGCEACRLLDRTILANSETARTLNRHFVSIRVDREERPDLWETYSVAARALNGRPAWPLLAFLTSEGRAFQAVSLLEATSGLQGVAVRIAEAYKRDRGALERRADEALRGFGGPPPDAPQSVLAASMARSVAQSLAATLQATTDAPSEAVRRRPHNALAFLVAEFVRNGNADALHALDGLLDRTARSGVRDHVGGGFHRGPAGPELGDHGFEKLLSDNALLLRVYAQAYGVTKNLFYRNVAREIAAWATREMRDASGAFWSSVDSASQGREGTFYLWSPDEVAKVLGPERTAEFLKTYRNEPPGVLVLEGSPFAGLGPSMEVLRTRRGRRVKPAIDARILAGSNGLMIGALATCGRVLKRGADLEAARRAAGAVIEGMGPPGALKHSVLDSKGSALLQDYAYLAEGLLDLYDATGEPRWRDQALALADAAITRFWDPSGTGFFGADARHGAASLRVKTARDTELPSANAVMAKVLLRLGRFAGEERYTRLARRTIEAFLPELDRNPRGMETLAGAAADFVTLSPGDPGVPPKP